MLCSACRGASAHLGRVHHPIKALLHARQAVHEIRVLLEADGVVLPPSYGDDELARFAQARGHNNTPHPHSHSHIRSRVPRINYNNNRSKLQ